MENKDEKYIEDLLLGYFAKELADQQERELLEWLNENPSHRDTFSKAADSWATAHVPLFMANMQSGLDGFFGRQDQKKHSRSNLRKFKPVFFGNIAAAILILAVVGSLSYYMGQRESRDNLLEFMASRQVFSKITTPRGATSKILLPDGSQAWLNAGTHLTYTCNYGKGIREVHLDGEAYFDVVPDENHPFVVKSNNLDIKVLGTAFNVKSYPNDEQIKVALVTGSVHVKVGRPEEEAMDFTLSPDRMLTFNKETENVEIKEFRKGDVLAWTANELKFENLSFVNLAKDLERKFDVRIRIESERLKKEIFSGSFSSGYFLEQILREVDMERKYSWTRQKDEIIIRDN
jgi:ferric-dicitrate binding protein FerR (iron transport regulator)